MSYPPAIKTISSSKEFKPAIVLVGLDAIESLYHLLLFISLTNSSLCVTPSKFFIAVTWSSISTKSFVAAIAAHIFAALWIPLSLVSFNFITCLLNSSSTIFIIPSSYITPFFSFSFMLKKITFDFAFFEKFLVISLS